MKKNLIGFGAVILSAVFVPLVMQAVVTPAVAATDGTRIIQGEERQKVIADANKAINSLSKLQGKFTQRNPDNTTTSGTFYLSRPGKMRFEYGNPADVVMVSDGTNVGISDRRLKNLNQYALKSTPLYFLLKPKVDLAKELNITHVVSVGDSKVVYLQDKKKQTQGELRLVFDADMQLREWAVVTGQRQMTYVKLSEVKSVSGFDSKLFVINDPRKLYGRSASGK